MIMSIITYLHIFQKIDFNIYLFVFRKCAMKAKDQKSSNVLPPESKKPRLSLPLHQAIFYGDEYFIEKLFHYQCAPDISAKDELGLTPLHLAVLKKKQNIAKILIRNGANVNAKSSETKLLPEIDALIDHDLGMMYANCFKHGFVKLTPLHIAALNGSLDVVVDLLKNGADIDAEVTANGARPLLCAIYSDSKKMVRLLMENGAKIELYGDYCEYDENDEKIEMTNAEKVVCYAAARGKIKVLKMMLDNGTQLKDNFLVYVAAANGFEEILHLFLKSGINIGLPIRRGPQYRPVLEAVSCGYSSIVKLLLENGADPEPDVYDMDDVDHSPLHIAVQENDILSAWSLIQHGADINNIAEWDEGKAPLYYAVQERNIHMIRLLIACNADFNNYATDDLITPLHLVIANEDSLAIEALVQNGAKCENRFIDHDSPMDMVLKKEKVNGFKMFLYQMHIYVV